MSAVLHDAMDTVYALDDALRFSKLITIV